MKALYLFMVLMFALPSYVRGQEQGEDAEDFEVVKQAPPVTENTDSEVANGMAIGNPGYAGTGCPAGTASSALSPDRKTMSLIFDRYIVEAGNPTGKKTDLKTCNLLIPIYVPTGYRVQVVRLDYRGYNLIPARGRTSYAAFYTFDEKRARKALTKRVKRQKIFQGPLNDNYTLIGRVRGQHWSKCGEDFNLTILTQIGAQSNNELEQTMATVDSLDAQGTDELKYHLRWKACGGNKNGNGGKKTRISLPLR